MHLYGLFSPSLVLHFTGSPLVLLHYGGSWFLPPWISFSFLCFVLSWGLRGSEPWGWIFVYADKHCCDVGHLNIILYMVGRWRYIACSC